MSKETKSNKREILLRLYIAIVFSAFTVFPVYDDTSEKIRFLSWAVSFVIWYVIAWIICKSADWLRESYSRIHLHRLDGFVMNISDIRFFLMCWILLMIIWIPAFCCLYPGTFGYDAPLQLLQYHGVNLLTTHHPLIHTIFIGLLYDLGTKVLGGSPNTGIATQIITQAVITSGSIAYGLLTLRRCGVRTVGIILSFLWLAFNPYIQALTFNSTKDILFGAFLSVFIFIFWQILWSGKWNRTNAVSFTVFGILTCLFRHQGIYFFAALLLFLIIAPRNIHKAKKQMVIAVAIIVAFFEIFSFVCHSVMKIESGDKREMLSVPMQQMAYVCKMKKEGQEINVSDEQLAQVETFIPNDGVMYYLPVAADPVKERFSTANFTEDLWNNIATYIKLGLQNPNEYYYAFRTLTEGFIDSDKMPNVELLFRYTFQDRYDQDIHRSPIEFESYYDILQNNTVNNENQKIPLLSTVYRPSLCVWLLAALIGVVFYRRDYKLWLLILPILLLCISLFLGPMALIRYLYPIMLLVPFMMICLLKKNEIN